MKPFSMPLSWPAGAGAAFGAAEGVAAHQGVEGGQVHPCTAIQNSISATQVSARRGRSRRVRRAQRQPQEILQPGAQRVDPAPPSRAPRSAGRRRRAAGPGGRRGRSPGRRPIRGSRAGRCRPPRRGESRAAAPPGRRCGPAGGGGGCVGRRGGGFAEDVFGGVSALLRRRCAGPSSWRSTSARARRARAAGGAFDSRWRVGTVSGAGSGRRSPRCRRSRRPAGRAGLQVAADQVAEALRSSSSSGAAPIQVA
jgi:hypothetical protein